MFALDRETTIALAIVACIATSYYIYTDLKKSKDDISRIKRFLDSVTSGPEEVYMRGAPPQAVTEVQREAVIQKVQPEIINEDQGSAIKSSE